jgi:phenylpyruvate tautomerase PptA (4-oxalocrotonate tautomerase family)
MDKEEATIQLLRAADAGDVAMARAALEAGADIKAKTVAGETPLDLAILYRHDDVAKLLKAAAKQQQYLDAVRGNAPHVVVKLWPGLSDGKKNLLAEQISKDVTTSLNYEKGSVPVIFEELTYTAEQQHGHAGRVTGERKDKGPPQVGG